MPQDFNEKAVSATGFDFTRRDSLGVNFRDIPTMLYQTIEWINIDAFGIVSENMFAISMNKAKCNELDVNLYMTSYAKNRADKSSK